MDDDLDLDGGIEGRPENVLFYATSNRRHLMPRDMIENERSTAINPGEAVEEKVSLSDRFGLWLGFHPCSQDDYLDMIRGYCAAHGVRVPEDRLQAEAIEWQATRGGRSGRVAGGCSAAVQADSVGTGSAGVGSRCSSSAPMSGAPPTSRCHGAPR